MKIIWGLLLVVSVTAGCSTSGAVGCRRSGGFSSDEPASPPPAPTMPEQNSGPQLVIPVTGGAPVVGIPLGGDLYQPVTGGPPVVGIPTDP